MGLHHSYKHVQWNLSDETTQGRGKKAVFKYKWSFNEGSNYVKCTKCKLSLKKSWLYIALSLITYKILDTIVL